jgi:glucokinase
VEIVVADIGGTHARFGIAQLIDRRVVALDDIVTLKTIEHASWQTAWHAYAAKLGRALPAAAGVAIACPIIGDVLKLTNNPWVIRPAGMAAELQLEALALINDFGAVAHAVARLGESDLRHLAGPEGPLPGEGVISIIGPGTGFGVAQLLRRKGHHVVIESEGGHMDFAPLDSLEDRLLARLRERFRRVSIERVVSGPGLVNIHEVLQAIEGQPIGGVDEKALWAAAIDRADPLAAAALDRFCLCLGAIAGDIALAHGASGVVLSGGLAQRIETLLPHSGFVERFVAKGRFERMMAAIPVKLVCHPHPGLFGVAVAFAEGEGREWN